MPRPYNIALVEGVEALQLEGPRGSWWCLNCNSTATEQCVPEHERTRPQTALRLVLQDVVPQASQALQELSDGAALTALRLLPGPLSTCRVTFGTERGAEDSLVHTLVILALAASGRLVQEPADERIEDLNDLSYSGPGDRREEKEEMLLRVRGVRRMTNVHCDRDPDWVLDVLRSAAPRLEELEVWDAREPHLNVVHEMPLLQRLHLHASLEQRPVLLPAQHWPRCLKWLRVWRLPLATTVSLLRAHAASLDVLWLWVGSRPRRKWPWGCDDLEALLGRLRLTRLVLWRPVWWNREKNVCHGFSCRAQLEAARRVLPGCTVQCTKCDGVPYEDF